VYTLISVLVGAISGYAVVVLFIAMAVYTYSTAGFKSDIMHGNTISIFGEDPKIRPFIQTGCISSAMLNFFYLYGITAKYGSLNIQTTLVYGFLSSIFLAITGLTVSKPKSPLHRIVAWGFMVFLLLYGVSSGILVIKSNLVMGEIMLVINYITILAIPPLVFKYKNSGITELSFLGFNALWLLIGTTALIL